MKTFTKDEQIENLLVARAMMMDVDEEAIDLNQFASGQMLRKGPRSCGACACFGGYVASNLFFKSLGVRADGIGAPYADGGLFSSDVAREIFGVRSMFGMRRRPEIPQKQEVLDRIDAQLEVLLGAA